MQSQTFSSSLLEQIKENADSKEWGKAQHILKNDDAFFKTERFENFFKGSIEDSLTLQREEVRIKINEPGAFIQWLECTCTVHKKEHLLCSHIISFLEYIGRKKFLKDWGTYKLSHIPKKKTQKEDSSFQAQNKNHSMEVVLPHIYKVVKNPNPQTPLTLFYKLNHLNYEKRLGIDESARFLLNNAKSSFKKTIPILKKEAFLGFLIEKENRGIEIKKTLIVRLGDNEKPGFESLGAVKMKLQGYKALELYDHGIHVGDQYCYFDSFGFFPLAQPADLEAWQKTKPIIRLNLDKTAELIQSEFDVFSKIAPVFLAKDIANLKVADKIHISPLETTEDELGNFYLNPKIDLNSSPLRLTELIEQSKNSNYMEHNGALVKIPAMFQKYPWNIEKVGDKKFIKATKLELIRLTREFSTNPDLDVEKTSLAEVEKKLSFSQKTPAPKTALKLRPYQLLGYKWMWWLYKNHFHGLLADDMGLGKTHQTMAILSSIQNEALEIQSNIQEKKMMKGAEVKEQQAEESQHFLILCPKSVMDHWYDKINEFAPNLCPIFYEGKERFEGSKNWNKSQTIIVSYGIFLRDIVQLGKIFWKSVVLDEAHLIKNHKTSTFKAACTLKTQLRICLSGTPMENHLKELKTIFDFLLPGYLGTNQSFNLEFVRHEKNQTIEQRAEKEQKLKNILQPFILRRTKDHVLKELPPKQEDLRHCSMGQNQEELYNQIITQQAIPLMERYKTAPNQISAVHILSLIHSLKRICNHQALFFKTPEDYKNYECPKFDLVCELIEEAIVQNKKVVIFTQYLEMIDIFASYFDSKKIQTVCLSGKSKNRGQLIHSFQNDPNIKVFIGSLLAGGMGIDLTAASLVIHYDRWWNPSKENQATDRVHRMGQDKFVQVVKIITKNTIEEKIHLLIEKKKAILSQFMEQNQNIFTFLKKEEVMDLFSRD